MSFPLLCDPTDGAENRAAADVSRSAPAVPLLASAQSISAPNGPLSAVRELAEALARRAADRAGFVAAAPPVPDGDGAVLLVGLWTSYAALRAAVLDSGTEVRAWRARTGLVPVSERALWWTRDPVLPDPEEARARLARLRAEGPGVPAFTLRSPVPPPR